MVLTVPSGGASRLAPTAWVPNCCAWAWPSMNPGISVLPPRSFSTVPSACCLSASALLPTKMILPSSTTIASTVVGWSPSIVTMGPPVMMRSAAPPGPRRGWCRPASGCRRQAGGRRRGPRRWLGCVSWKLPWIWTVVQSIHAPPRSLPERPGSGTVLDIAAMLERRLHAGTSLSAPSDGPPVPDRRRHRDLADVQAGVRARRTSATSSSWTTPRVVRRCDSTIASLP